MFPLISIYVRIQVHECNEELGTLERPVVSDIISTSFETIPLFALNWLNVGHYDPQEFEGR